MSSNNEITIVNEVLAYVSHHIHDSTIDNIRKIALNFYNNDDLLEAKRRLWKIENHNLGTFVERRDSDNRTCSEANFTDIADALIKLDAEQKLPNFLVKNIEKLPGRHPEELNLLFLIERVAKMERILKDQSDTLSMHGIQLMEITDKNLKMKTFAPGKSVDTILSKNITESKDDSDIEEIVAEEIISRIKTHSDDTTPSDVQNMGVETINGDIDVNNDDSESHVKRDDIVENSTECKGNRSKANSMLTPCNNRNTSKPNSSVKALIDIYDKNSTNGKYVFDNEGYRLVESNSERKKRMSANNGLIGAPEPKGCIWVYKLMQGSAMALKDFIHNRNVVFDKITRTSHSEAKYKSFKIIASKSELDKMLDRNFWPRGVKCKLWREKQNSGSKYNRFNSRIINSSHFA